MGTFKNGCARKLLFEKMCWGLGYNQASATISQCETKHNKAMMRPVKILLGLVFALMAVSGYAQTDVKKMIRNNDLDGIEDYCSGVLFYHYGSYAVGDCLVLPIDNEKAGEVMEALRYGAKKKRPNCQFMLACVLSESKTVRGGICDGEDNVFPPSKDYKYLDDKKAQELFIAYWMNPKTERENGPFGGPRDRIEQMINNAYPHLLELHERRLRLDAIRKAASEGIRDAAPRFGLG